MLLALNGDASTKSYVNTDAAANLRLQGHKQTVIVNVLNGGVERIDTMSVDIGLNSIDGQVYCYITAYTVDSVTGDMTMTDWRCDTGRWSHLKGIPLPEIGHSPHVDLFIGLARSALHFSYDDIGVKEGEPTDRLIAPWLCLCLCMMLWWIVKQWIVMI